MKKLLALLLVLALSVPTLAEEEVINLPAPVKTGGLPLMEAINLRKSLSSFHDT